MLTVSKQYGNFNVIHMESTSGLFTKPDQLILNFIAETKYVRICKTILEKKNKGQMPTWYPNISQTIMTKNVN